jgi:hypothetical protein
MPLTCKRPPGGGGDAVHSLGGDGSEHTKIAGHCHSRPVTLADLLANFTLFCGKWPVRAHLRPKTWRKVRTEADVSAWLLRLYPGLVAELNVCPIEIWAGEGKPGAGWDGWSYEHLPLDVPLLLPWAGEA